MSAIWEIKGAPTILGTEYLEPSVPGTATVIALTEQVARGFIPAS